jgi:hypothetical protein
MIEMLAVVCGLGIAGLGVLVAVIPPKRARAKWAYLSAFVVLGFCSIALALIQSSRTAKAQQESKDLLAAIDHRTKEIKTQGERPIEVVAKFPPLPTQTPRERPRETSHVLGPVIIAGDHPVMAIENQVLFRVWSQSAGGTGIRILIPGQDQPVQCDLAVGDRCEFTFRGAQYFVTLLACDVNGGTISIDRRL